MLSTQSIQEKIAKVQEMHKTSSYEKSTIETQIDALMDKKDVVNKNLTALENQYMLLNALLEESKKDDTEPVKEEKKETVPSTETKVADLLKNGNGKLSKDSSRKKHEEAIPVDLPPLSDSTEKSN